MSKVRNALQAASNTAAGTISAPVDGLAWLLRKAGVPVPANPLMGSDWMAQRGLTAPVQQGAGQVVGETLGMLAPTAVAMQAPRIAQGLLAMGRNMEAPRALGTQAGAIDVEALRKAFPNIDFSLWQKGNTANLSSIKVPKGERGQGKGSEFMRALSQAADSDGARLTLSPSTDFGATSKARLVDFYKRFGFEKNAGKNKDLTISESMLREPRNGNALQQPAGTMQGVKPLPYQIDHKPMTKAGGAATLDDLSPAFGEDIYGKNALQYFGSGDPRERAIVRQLANLRGKPDAPVTVYRGVPKDATGINAGDWVTLDPKAAADYAAQHPGGKVVSMQVPAKHVTSWSDSLLEFGYYPHD